MRASAVGRLRRLHGLPWLVLLALNSVCGSNGGGASVDDLVDRMARAQCAWQLRCCSGQEIATLSGTTYATEDDCLPRVRLALRAQLEVERALVVSGRLRLDPAVAASCVAAMESRPCNIPQPNTFPLPLSTPDATGCIPAFVGNVPAGGKCSGNGDCVPGAHCLSQSGGPVPFEGIPGTATGDGICAFPTQKLGDICASDADCDASQGLYCRGSDFRCAPFAKEGEPCGTPPVSPVLIACDAAAGLHCDTTSGLCRRPPQAGEPCLSDGSTPSGCDPDLALQLSCVGAGFNGSGVCLTPGQAGDACGGAGLAPCGPGLICPGQSLGAIDTCQAPPRLGQPCTTDRLCGAGTACAATTSTCEPSGPLPNGAPCAADTDCASLSCLAQPSGQRACYPSTASVSCSGVSGASYGQGGFGGVGGGFGGVGGGFGGQGGGFGGDGGSTGEGGQGGDGADAGLPLSSMP
jgi:hypothetical protein